MSNAGKDDDVIAPQYNFEDLIEKALQEQPQPRGGNQGIRRSKTTRGESEGEQEENEESSKPKVDKNKKDNLKKRQKYDPRKAIEEAKKKEEQNQKDA